MKQTFSKTLAGCAAAVLMTGALLTPVMGADVSRRWQTADRDDIGKTRAEEIALDHAGLEASQLTWSHVKLDYDHGRAEYEVEFFSGAREYDYEIDAVSGDILGFDCDVEWYGGGGAPAQSGGDIGAGEAKTIALDHAGVKEKDTMFLYAEPDYENGRRVYDVEFFAGNREYDYKVDGATGEILGFDFDIEWYTISTTEGDYIGEAGAKEIVERAAGAAGVYTEFKLEVDDGRVLYEGEMRNGRMEYEFEIDAVTGAILDWEADWD